MKTNTQTQINTTMSLNAWLMLIVLSILWGGSFFFVEVVLEALPTLSIVALRVALATMVLWMVVWASKLPIPKQPSIYWGFLLMGLLNNAIPFILITWGQTQIASGLAAILNAAVPFFTVVVAGLLLPDEKVSSLKVSGVLVGFAGVALMIGLTDMGSGYQLLAQLAVLLAGLSYALAVTYGRRFKTLGVHPIVLAAGQTSASALLMLPIALMVDGLPDITLLSVNTISALLGLAILSTALAYILYFKILDAAGAINASLVTLLIPVSAILLGTFILGERLALMHFIGMAVIALGLSMIDGRLWQRTKNET